MYARFAVMTFWSACWPWPAGVVVACWTIRGLCCELVSGAFVPEVLMRGVAQRAQSAGFLGAVFDGQ